MYETIINDTVRYSFDVYWGKKCQSYTVVMTSQYMTICQLIIYYHNKFGNLIWISIEDMIYEFIMIFKDAW